METKNENVNDYAIQRVPLDRRRSTFNVAIVAAGYCIAMSGFFTGAAMAVGLTLSNALIAAVIGNTILSLYGGAIGSIGAREGLTSSRLSIYSFGKEGFKIVSTVLALTMAGWFAVQSGLFGETINALFPEAGFITNSNFAALWGGLLMMTTAYFGYKGLEKLSMVAVPLIVIVAIVGTVLAIQSSGGLSGTLAIIPVGEVTVAAGIVMVVGSFAGGAAAQADITRYSKDGKAAWIATIFGYLIANSFVIVAGYLTSLATGEDSLPHAMIMLGLGFGALIVLILAQWTTNDNNLYTSSLSLSNIFNIKRSNLVLIIGIVGSIAGGLGVANYFSDWLVILGIGIPPMAGIIIMDYFVVRKMQYKNIDINKLPNWSFNAIGAWVFGIIIGFSFNIGIQAINALIVSMIVYYILSKIRPTNIQIKE